jgi:hypothetical protein
MMMLAGPLPQDPTACHNQPPPAPSFPSPTSTHMNIKVYSPAPAATSHPVDVPP